MTWLASDFRMLGFKHKAGLGMVKGSRLPTDLRVTGFAGKLGLQSLAPNDT